MEQTNAKAAPHKAKAKTVENHAKESNENAKALLLAVKEMNRPRKVVRGKDGRVSHVEPM